MATFPREGGLHVAEFEAADNNLNDGAPDKASGFARQGVKK